VSSKLNVSVDKALCVGNLWCVRNLPGVFRTDAEGRAEVITPEGVSEEEVVDVAFGCPVGAISVTNAHSGEDLLD
jgi:ferredoxin